MSEIINEAELNEVSGGAVKVVPAPVECIKYSVKWGDCLSVLAERYGTTVSAIMAVNPAITNPDKIYANQVIYIPYKK